MARVSTATARAPSRRRAAAGRGPRATLGMPGRPHHDSVDVRDFIDVKRQAMAAHASQITETSFFLRCPTRSSRSVGHRVVHPPRGADRTPRRTSFGGRVGVRLLYLVRHGEAAAGWGDDADPGPRRPRSQPGRGWPTPSTGIGPLPLFTSPLRRCRRPRRRSPRRGASRRASSPASARSSPSLGPGGAAASGCAASCRARYAARTRAGAVARRRARRALRDRRRTRSCSPTSSRSTSAVGEATRRRPRRLLHTRQLLADRDRHTAGLEASSSAAERSQVLISATSGDRARRRVTSEGRRSRRSTSSSAPGAYYAPLEAVVDGDRRFSYAEFAVTEPTGSRTCS